MNTSYSHSRRKKLSKLNVVRFAIAKYQHNDFSSQDLAFFIRHDLDKYSSEMSEICGRSSSTRKGWSDQYKIGACLHTLFRQGIVSKTESRLGHIWHKTQKALREI